MEERNENNSDNDAIPEPKSKLQGLMRNAAPRISSIPSYPTFEEIPGTPDSGLLTHEDPEDILGASRSLDFTGESNDDSDIADYSDGDSSLSSSSSEESLTLTQRALRNRERHEQRIRELDEKYRDHVAPVVDAILQEGEDEENEDSLEEEQNRAPRGMLMKSTYLILNSLVEDETVGLPERIKVLLERYPHRESQIRALTSQLHATIGQVCSAKQRARYPDTVYVPSPIFITGPSGTGKTSIVCDVVEVLEKKENPNDSKETSRVGNAYINCATLEPSSIERLVVSAYSQLRPEEYNRLKRHRKQQRRRKRRKKSAQIGQISTDHSTKPSTGAAEPPATNHEPATLSHGQDNKSGTEKVETGTGDQLGLIADTQQKLQDDDGNDVSDRRVQPKRAVKTVLLDVSTNGLPGTPSKNQEMSAEGDSVEVSHSAVVAFGRSLQTFYGVGSKRCALLILDHSERLLSLSARKKKNEKTNFLAELLLLPKVMKLNLTIISISKQSTLNDSRLNNIAPAAKSLATISNGVHPLLIQFPAYRGHQVFRQILNTKQVLDRIIGQYNDEAIPMKPFMTKVVGAFTDSLVQFVSDSTRDITDFIRLGRSFWPVYIEPLGPHNIEKTLESVRKKMSTSNRVDGDLGQEIMAHLGQKFFNHIGTMSGDVTRLFLDSPVIVSAEFNVSLPKRGKRECKNNLPYLRSCLLLAAFICQNNRPDQDRKVFSIQGNGKRTNRTREKMQSSDNAAFASSSGELQQLKSLRPRPFPVERAFSIFATLVNLNPGKFCGSSLESLGSTRLYEDLAQLVDLGYLHPASFTGLVKGEQVNLNNSKYWCSLAKDEAANIAKQIQIPLHNYIV